MRARAAVQSRRLDEQTAEAAQLVEVANRQLRAAMALLTTSRSAAAGQCQAQNVAKSVAGSNPGASAATPAISGVLDALEGMSVAQLLSEWRLRAYVEASVEGLAARMRDLRRQLESISKQCAVHLAGN